MAEQLRLWFDARAREIADATARLATLIGGGLLIAWDFVRPAFVLALNILAALILLFEEWGWRPLSNFVAQLARFPLWAKAELWIAGLPPYGAVVALGVPSAVLIPAKLLGVFLLATGHIVSATVVIVAAKLASTALIARIFLLTKPALMQIAWFARAYEIFVPWQEALFARIRASWAWRYGRIVKWRVANYLRGTWLQLRPRLDAAWRDVRPRIVEFRERMRASVRALGSRFAALRASDPRRRLPPPEAPR
jgi:hypothetical protein